MNKPIGMVRLRGCRCRCGHEWFPRARVKPRTCPVCKSPRWDQPKRETAKKRALPPVDAIPSNHW